jgi:hypothetical protein
MSNNSSNTPITTTLKTIVIHRFKPTRGEVWAVALLAAIHANEVGSIIRKNSLTKNEANSGNFITVDVTGPNNVPLDDKKKEQYWTNEMTSPFTEILRSHGWLAEAERFCPWMRMIQEMDTHGDRGAAQLFRGRSRVTRDEEKLVAGSIDGPDIDIFKTILMGCADKFEHIPALLSGIEGQVCAVVAPDDDNRDGLITVDHMEYSFSRSLIPCVSVGDTVVVGQPLTTYYSDAGFEILRDMGLHVFTMIQRELDAEALVRQEVKVVQFEGIKALWLPTPGLDAHLQRYQQDSASDAQLLFLPSVDDTETVIYRCDNHREALTLACFLEEDRATKKFRSTHPNIRWASTYGGEAKTREAVHRVNSNLGANVSPEEHIEKLLRYIFSMQPSGFKALKVERTGKIGLVKPLVKQPTTERELEESTVNVARATTIEPVAVAQPEGGEATPVPVAVVVDVPTTAPKQTALVEQSSTGT